MIIIITCSLYYYLQLLICSFRLILRFSYLLLILIRKKKLITGHTKIAFPECARLRTGYGFDSRCVWCCFDSTHSDIFVLYLGAVVPWSPSVVSGTISDYWVLMLHLYEIVEDDVEEVESKDNLTRFTNEVISHSFS